MSRLHAALASVENAAARGVLSSVAWDDAFRISLSAAASAQAQAQAQAATMRRVQPRAQDARRRHELTAAALMPLDQ